MFYNEYSSNLYSRLLSLPLKIGGNFSLLIVLIDDLIPQVLKISLNASIINESPFLYCLAILKV